MSDETKAVIVLPAEVNELAVKVSANKQQEVQTVLQQIFTGTDDWEKQVDAIEVKDVNDKMSIELAETARKNAKQARLSAEKIFDAKRTEVQNEKAAFDLEDKLWLKAKQVMQLKFKAIEEKAEWKATFVKRFEAEQKELRTQKRINEVAKYAEINRIEFQEMSDESFASFLNGLKATHEAKIEAERKAEQERIENEKAEAEAREQQRLENERLKAEAEERERQIEAERKANEQKLAEAKAEEKRKQEIRSKRSEELRPFIIFIRDYSSLIEADEDSYQSQLNDIKIGAEQHWEYERKKQIKAQEEAEKLEAKLKAEREEKEKLEAELKAKREAEERAENERKQAELKAQAEAEKAAKAPVKKQLHNWVLGLTAGTPPVLNDTAKDIIEKFESFRNWALKEIENI